MRLSTSWILHISNLTTNKTPKFQTFHISFLYGLFGNTWKLWFQNLMAFACIFCKRKVSVTFWDDQSLMPSLYQTKLASVFKLKFFYRTCAVESTKKARGRVRYLIEIRAVCCNRCRIISVDSRNGLACGHLLRAKLCPELTLTDRAVSGRRGRLELEGMNDILPSDWVYDHISKNT